MHRVVSVFLLAHALAASACGRKEDPTPSVPTATAPSASTTSRAEGPAEPAPAPAPDTDPSALEPFGVEWSLAPTQRDVPRTMRVSFLAPQPGAWIARHERAARWSSWATKRAPYVTFTVSARTHADADPKGVAEAIAAATRQTLALRDNGVLAPAEVVPTVPGATRYDVTDPSGLTTTTWVHAQADEGWLAFCQVDHGKDADPALVDALVTACRKASMEVVDDAPDAEALAADAAHLDTCPAASQVSYRPGNAAVPITGDFGAVVAARAFMVAGNAVEVVLANHAREDWRRSARPQGAERVLELLLHPEDGAHVSGAPGRYPLKDGKSDGSAELHVADGWLDWDRSVPGADGVIDVEARTADKICGSFRFSAPDGTTIEGTFVAPLVVGRD